MSPEGLQARAKGNSFLREEIEKNSPWDSLNAKHVLSQYVLGPVEMQGWLSTFRWGKDDKVVRTDPRFNLLKDAVPLHRSSDLTQSGLTRVRAKELRSLYTHPCD